MCGTQVEIQIVEILIHNIALSRKIIGKCEIVSRYNKATKHWREMMCKKKGQKYPCYHTQNW